MSSPIAERDAVPRVVSRCIEPPRRKNASQRADNSLVTPAAHYPAHATRFIEPVILSAAQDLLPEQAASPEVGQAPRADGLPSRGVSCMPVARSLVRGLLLAILVAGAQ